MLNTQSLQEMGVIGGIGGSVGSPQLAFDNLRIRFGFSVSQAFARPSGPVVLGEQVQMLPALVVVVAMCFLEFGFGFAAYLKLQGLPW